MVAVLPDPPNIFDTPTEKNWFFEMFRRVQEDLKQRIEDNVSTTITGGGSMTVSNIVVNSNSNDTIGTNVFFSVDFTFDLSGTPSNEVVLDLPLDSEFDGVLMATVDDGSGFTSGYALTNQGTKTLQIRKFDNSNYTTGVNKAIRVSGWYRTNESY